MKEHLYIIMQNSYGEGKKMGEKDKLWEKVEKDFPCDPALQEVHYARLKLHEQTRGMSDQEFVRFIRMKAEKVIKEG